MAKPGRPKTPKEKQTSVQVAVKITPGAHKKLKEIALQNHSKISAFIRDLIMREIDCADGN